jgi:two-component system, response regulator YesN
MYRRQRSITQGPKTVGIHGLLLNWMISYAMILLIAFLFIVSGYLILSRNLRDESIRLNRANVQQSQISMDYLLSEIELITNEVIVLPEIQSLGGFEGELGNRQYYLKNQLRDELSKLHGSHPAIESVFVYFWPAEYIVSSMAAYEVDYYFETYYGQAGVAQEDWLSTLMAHDGYVKTTSFVQTGSGDIASPHIQFITAGLPMFAPEKTQVVICLTIKESTIKSLIGVKEGSFFIIDQNDTVYLDEGIGLPADFPTYTQLLGSKRVDTIIDDQILTHFPSRFIDWQYVTLSAQSVVESRLSKLRWFFTGLVAVFWIFGASLAYVFAQRNYRPVAKLIDHISGATTKEELTHFRRKEYQYIEESFNRLKEEKASIQDQLAVQQVTLRAGFLSRLLLGRIKETSHTLEEQCEYHGFYFETDAFVAVALKMEDTILNSNQLSQEYGAVWLANQTQSVLSRHTNGDGWVCEVSNLPVLFLNIQEPSDDPQLVLTELLSDLQQHLLNETGITYTIGASSFVGDLSAIPFAYEEAQAALDYRMVHGKGAIITYYDVLEQEQEQKMDNTLRWERRFIGLFTSGKYGEASELMQNIMSRLEHVPNLPKIRIRLFAYINLFLDAMGDLFDDEFLAELDCESRLLACSTLKETRAEMANLFREIQDYTLDAGRTSMQERVSIIIEEKYMDPNLSVGYIAERIGLSISNFSWIYKEETGHGPLDRIHRVRLREAKRLLQESTLAVKRIAKNCGYLSDIAFIRVFKKYEGITPGQYRTQIPALS